MDLPLLNKIKVHIGQYVNRNLLFDILESKRIVKVGIYFDDLNMDIALNKLSLLEKARIFQDLGHEIVVIFNDYKYKDSLSESNILERIKVLSNGISVIVNIKKAKIVRNSTYQLSSKLIITSQDRFLADIEKNNITIELISFEDRVLVKHLHYNRLNDKCLLILDSSYATKILANIKLTKSLSYISRKLEEVSKKLLPDIMFKYSDLQKETCCCILQELKSTNRDVFKKARSKIILNILGKIFPSDINKFTLKYLIALQKLKVSVIIATYNGIDFLPEAIDSLFRQFYKNIEIIIIDDGSIDGTKQYCNYIQNKYRGVYNIKYFYQKNKGVGSARNIGLRKATGDLITIFDQDDYMLEDGIIDRVIPFINNPVIDVVYAKRDTLLDDGYKRIRQKRYEPYHDDGFIMFKTKEEQFSYLIKRQVTFGANTMMYRKKILKKTGLFYEERKFMGLEHNAFLLNVFNNYFVNFVDSVVYLMRRNHTGNHLSKRFENNSLRKEIFTNTLLPKVLKELKIYKK